MTNIYIYKYIQNVYVYIYCKNNIGRELVEKIKL